MPAALALLLSAVLTEARGAGRGGRGAA